MVSELNYIRSQFPALSGDKVYFDNAGGTQVVRYVGERLLDYLYKTNVQLGATYKVSELSTARVEEARQTWAGMINANADGEVIFGSSTTQLLQNLSKSMVQTFKPGDEVIVTNFDHEANIGPWIDMQKQGVVVKSWKIDPETFTADVEQLRRLLNPKTKLVTFTHVSNILGTLNPVKEITQMVHEYGARVCVDGVACAPHRAIDVKELDVDFYVFSLYKVYGPHVSLLYGKKEHLLKLPGINHYFIGENEIPYKFQPGNVNYELSYASLGIIDYINKLSDNFQSSNQASQKEKYHDIFKEIAAFEEKLSARFLEYLNSTPKIKVIGATSSDENIRVPTFSFTIENKKSSEIPPQVDPHNIGIRWGDFYARRLITDLGLTEQDGIVRVSLVHYNTLEEVDRLITVLQKFIK